MIADSVIGDGAVIIIVFFLYRLWQKGLSSDLPETEMMTQLLAAFKTIKGFEDRAKQLAEDCGDCS